MSGARWHVLVSLGALLTTLLVTPAAHAQRETCAGQTITITGTASADTIQGTPGDDTIAARGGDDTIDGRGGNDNICGEGGNDSLNGGDGTDYLEGEEGVDSLVGGDGDDILVGGPEGDSLDGGAGSDQIAYYNSPQGITIDLSAGAASGGEADGDHYTGIEGVDSTEFDDHLTGDDGLNFFYARDGDDELHAGAGDDLFDAGPGADLIDGGEGIDHSDYSYSRTGAGVSVDLSTGSASGGDAEGDSLVAMESVGGSLFDDTLLGSSGSDGLYGNAGNDTLIGGDGDDYLSGELGNDHEDGGEGVDTFRQLEADDGSDVLIGGGGEADHLDYYARSKPIKVSTDGKADDGYPGENDNVGADIEILGGASGDDNFVGSGGKDTLKVKAGNDSADGKAGDDRLLGGPGNDKLNGGPGKDVLNGGPGRDTCVLDDPADVAKACEQKKRNF